MKTYFTAPIANEDQVRRFFSGLIDDNLLFHCEDDPSAIVDSFGLQLFSEEESALLRLRMSEIFSIHPDPCKIALEVLELKESV